MEKMRLKIQTFGCKVNQYDSDYLKKSLSGSFAVCKDDADLAIVNTCVVTKMAIAKARNIIRKIKKENPRAKIVVLGCWPQVYDGEVEKIGIDLAWGVGNLDGLSRKIFDILDIEPTKLDDSVDLNLDKSRYFMKIQEGCEQFCSYCVIPLARGRLKSRPVDDVIAEARSVVRQGYREIILSGTHLGLYGVSDKNDFPFGLVNLLKELVEIDGLERIRLSSIEVNEVTGELIDLMVKNRKICRHLHIPLQSGSDNILRLMNRPYDKRAFRDKVERLRSVMPLIAITTDVIVGFPGEGEAEFEEARDFIREIGFSQLHVFSFSAHEKTRAFTMSSQVSKAEIVRRSQELHVLSLALEREYRERFVGQELSVIVEKSREKGKMIGKTEYYFDVDIACETDDCPEIGSLIKIIA